MCIERDVAGRARCRPPCPSCLLAPFGRLPRRCYASGRRRPRPSSTRKCRSCPSWPPRPTPTSLVCVSSAPVRALSLFVCVYVWFPLCVCPLGWWWLTTETRCAFFFVGVHRAAGDWHGPGGPRVALRHSSQRDRLGLSRRPPRIHGTGTGRAGIVIRKPALAGVAPLQTPVILAPPCSRCSR